MPENDTSLTVVMERLTSRIDSLIAKQEEIAEDISQIKEAVYNPDKGIFARVRVLEQIIIPEGAVRISQIESTIATMKKAQWTVMGTALATITAMILKSFV